MAQTLKRIANNGSVNDFQVIADTQGAFAPNPNNKYIGPPDYARTESTSRITENNGTWTVDRDGYVYAYIHPGSGTAYGYIYVNSKEVFVCYGPGGVTLDVKAGDVVKITGGSGFTAGSGCWYIPPRYVEFPALIGSAQSSSDPGKVTIDPVTREMSVNFGNLLPVKAGGPMPNAGNIVSATKGDITVWVKRNSGNNLAEIGYTFPTARGTFYGYSSAYGSAGTEYRTGNGTAASVVMDSDAGYSSGSMYVGQIIDLTNNTPYQFSITVGNNGTQGQAHWAGVTVW
jgi:hypothetical protein